MPEGHEILDEDELHLARLGYNQELQRSWSGFNNFAISFSIISILAGCFTSFGLGWNNGGPAAIAWGWPILAAFILLVGLSLSELVSAYPTSGGIYWWAAKLGGPKAGYYTGWLNLIGLIAILASVAYGSATFLDLTLGTLSESWLAGYSLTRVFVMFLVILVVVAVINIFSSHLLAVINNISVWWHVAGAATVIGILFLAPERHASVSDVFAKTINNSGMFGGATSGWGWLLLVLPISAILTQYTITGYDASAHLSEETKSAANAAAKGIWRSIFYSAIGGWILLLSFLFAVQDSDGVSAAGGAVASIFSQALSTKWAALVLLISTAGQLFCTTACQTSASRMLFAFSRDRAVPGHQLWSAINANKVPANAVMVTAGIAALLTLPALVEVDVKRRPGSGGLFRGGLDRCSGSVPVLRRSDLLPLESRRLVPGRLLEPARPLSLDGTPGAGRNPHHVDRGDVPHLAGRRAMGSQLRVEVRQLHATGGVRRAVPAVAVLARFGEEVVHRSGSSGGHHR